MPATPPTRFSLSKILLIRAAKRLLWPHPSIYYPFGLARNRGSVFDKRNVDIYIEGYPRSGNTFSRIAFLSANPGTHLQTHKHIPTFVLHLLKCRVPGMVLIRQPLDAAVSWAIHENRSLEEAAAYWNDYYSALLPARSELLMAPFKEVTSDFGNMIKALNARWGTSYVPFEHTPVNAARCFQLVEDRYREVKGEVRESQVCRPSKVRRIVKETHLEHLEQSNFLQDELGRANEVYDMFVSQRSKDERRLTTRLVPQEVGEEARQAGATVI